MGSKISIEKYVEQVTEGTRYKGHLKIAENTFNYELYFATHISRMDDEEPIASIEKARKDFQITVKKGEKGIELADKEYGFFFQMLVEFAIRFYNNPQTQSSNRGSMGQLMQGRDSMAAFGASASIGVASSGTCDFPLEVREMLNLEKFNCKIQSLLYQRQKSLCLKNEGFSTHLFYFPI